MAVSLQSSDMAGRQRAVSPTGFAADAPLPSVEDQLHELERLLNDDALAATPRKAAATPPPLQARAVPSFAPAATTPPPAPRPADTFAASLHRTPAASSKKPVMADLLNAPSQFVIPTPPLLRAATDAPFDGNEGLKARDTLPPNVQERPVIPPLELTPDEKKKVADGVKDEQLQGIQKQVDELYQQVITVLGPNQKASDYALRLLKEARLIALGRTGDYAEAEYRIQQVRALVLRRTESEQHGRRYGIVLFAYEAIFLLGLLGLFFSSYLTQGAAADWLAKMVVASGGLNTMEYVFPFWSTFLWGGIGGAIGGLYSLWWHVSEEQDFDRQYTLWYIAQPVMGIVLGGIIYLTISAGFLVLQAEPVFNRDGLGGWIGPALIGCIAGFRQNFVYDLFSRIITSFIPRKEEQAS